MRLIVASTIASERTRSASSAEQAEPRVLEEAGVDHARAGRDPGRRCRRCRPIAAFGIAGLREPDEVRARAQRAVGGQRPGLEVALELVGHAAPDGGAESRSPLMSAISRGGEQTGDLGGDRRGRVAALLLPALGAERRPVGGDEVRRRADVRPCSSRAREADGERHDQRVGALVELGVEAVGRLLAVGEAVARHRAVGQLLALEQEARHVARRARGRRRRRRRPGLVEVAARRPRGRSRSTCWRGRRPTIACPHGEASAAAMAPGNVLSVGGLDVVGAQVVLVEQVVPVAAADALRAPRLDQVVVVAMPAGEVRRARSAKRLAQRPPSGADAPPPGSRRSRARA